MTIIEGFKGDTDIEPPGSELNSALGTGGIVKEDAIELQGIHEGRVRERLKEN